MAAGALGATPLGYDPLVSDDGAVREGALGSLLRNAGRNQSDEDLAFAGGAMGPSSDGTFGAMANGFKAESAMRLEKDKLITQYIPLIQQAMQARYESAMLGGTYGDGAQTAPAQGAPGNAGGNGAPGAGAIGGVQAAGAGPAGNQFSTGNALFDRVLNGTFAQAVAADAGTGGRYKFADAWKFAHEGIKHEAGTYTTDVAGDHYFPKLPDGMAPNGKGGVGYLNNFAEEQARGAGLTTSAQKSAEDPFAPPITVNMPGGPRLMSPAQARAMTGGAPGAGAVAAPGSGYSANKPDSNVQGRFYGDPADVIAGIAQMKDPQEQANALKAFEDQMRSTGGKLPPNPDAQGPGTALQKPEQKTFLEGRAKQANEYENSLNERVRQGSELNMRLQEQIAALDKFRAGGGGETRAHLAQLAQGVPGMPQAVVNGIAGGDLASMQEFNKLAAQTAMEQLKASMGGSGRIAQMEFKVFLQNNPNLSTDPNAIKKIFDFNTRLFQRDGLEQKAFNSWVNEGRNPAEFQSAWQQELVKRGIVKPDVGTKAQAPTQATSPFSNDAIATELKRRGGGQ